MLSNILIILSLPHFINTGKEIDVEFDDSGSSEHDQQQMVEKFEQSREEFTKAEHFFRQLIPHYQTRMRTDESFYSLMTKMYPSDCGCEAVSKSMRGAANFSHIMGNIAISALCDQLKPTSPVSKEECKCFNQILFDSAMNMTIELSAEDVLCPMIFGDCNAVVPVNKEEPVSCSFCQVLHAKALKITHNFAGMFKAFMLMCRRLDFANQNICRRYVERMTRDIRTITEHHLEPLMSAQYCSSMFKCKN